MNIYGENLPEKEELTEYNRKKKITYFNSIFSFLKAHNGIRPSSLHGMIGTKGSGKSSLIKNLIIQCAMQDRVMVWLSEESNTQYFGNVFKFIGDEVYETIKNRTSVISERQMPIKHGKAIKDHRENLELLKDCVFHDNIKVLFIDNLTSSFLYSGTPEQQSMTADFLTTLCKESGIAVFYIAHTKKEITNNYSRLLTGEDIRGTDRVPINTEYMYTLQRYDTQDKIITILNIVKCRDYITNGDLYSLIYDKEFMTYVRDVSISFDAFKEIFKQRNKLTER